MSLSREFSLPARVCDAMHTKVLLLPISRTAALAVALAASACLLQGCLPVVAAGVGTAAAVATDRRQPDTMIGDERVELLLAHHPVEQVVARDLQAPGAGRRVGLVGQPGRVVCLLEVLLPEDR